MADITSRVRFIGDASQLLATYRAIGAQAAALEKQINQVNNARLRQLNLTPAGRGDLSSKNPTLGPVAKNTRIELDALNKTFRTFTDTAIRFKKNGRVFESFTGEVPGVIGDYDKLITAATEYNSATTRFDRASAVYKRAAQPIRDQARASVEAARAFKAQEAAEKAHARQLAKNGQAIRLSNGQYGTLSQRLSELTRQYRLFDSSGRIATLQRFTQEIVSQSEAARQALPQFTRLAAARQRLAGAGLGVDAALSATPPLPAHFQQLQRLSPRLTTELQRRGLGATSEQLYAQNFRTSVERDLIRGTTHIRGSFDDLTTGIRQGFNAELDKSGKLVTRFGGHLSGLQNLLEQTVRNFQKVVLWGVATTAVFGTIAAAVSQLRTLTELDKNLKQLGITANLTNEQTHALFGDLADVALRTATPLAEITKAADDIALAVRGSGKSAQEYTQDILNLTEAVGIYTNLTGEDTVKATDLLVSSMKQLHIQTEDIPALLSKITAVAGGQSTAISDITQGLAVMAEAARQAGLSVDETIAAVQVLGQVTAKSPSEIATAFKNLVGALDSRAGAKALAKFNIDLRDGAGNIRNILDIYQEISDKIRQGIIPANEVKALVKAIAGGPRRAPDAAALLSNIDQIAQAERRSIRASNEALLVNAKVLDTVQAKVTQIQVAFDKFAFQTFGQGLAGFVEGLANSLTTLLQILGSIPSTFITAALQAGLFIAAVRLGIGVVRSVVGQLNGLSLTLRETAAAYGTAATAAKEFNTSTVLGPNGKPIQTPVNTGSRFQRIKGTLGGAALGFGLGAAVSAGTGGDIKSILSGGLSGAGLALLSIPSPDPYTKLAGGAALLGSVLINLLDDTENTTKALQDNAQAAESVLNSYGKYKDASDTISDLTKVQSDLAKGIADLQGKEDKSTAELSLLNDEQKQYVQNVIAMTNATSEMEASLSAIREINEPFAALIEGMKNGEVTADEFAAKLRELQLQILRQSNPNAQLPEDIGLVNPLSNAPVVGYKGDRTAYLPSRQVVRPTYKGSFVDTVGPSQFDLNELSNKPGLVKDLFKDGKLNARIQATGENIALISEALRKLREQGDPAAVTMEANFKQWILGASAADAARVAIDALAERIKTIGQYDPTRAGGLQKLLDLVNKINESGLRRGTATPGQEAITRLNTITEKELPLDQQNVQPFITAYARELGAANDKTLNAVDRMTELRVIVESFGLPWEKFAEAAAGAFDVLSEATAEAQGELSDFADKLTSDAVGNTAELTAQIQSGEFKDDKPGLKKAKADLAYNQELIDSINEVNKAYQGLQVKVEDLDPAYQSMANQLTSINGLQDAQTLTTEQLIERLFSLADTYGLTGVEVVKLSDKIVGLLQTIQEVAKVRAEFKIGADVDLSQAIAKLQALRRAMIAGAQRGGGGMGSGVAADTSGIDAAIATLVGAQKSFSSLKQTFTTSSPTNRNRLGVASSSPIRSSSGGGSRSGSAPKSFNDLFDVSDIDLPEEIANASNRNALIQQAIKNARRLQSQIPGATAEGKNDVVELLKGTQRILEVRGVKDDLLRKALEELAEVEKKRLEFETKADTIRRIRVQGGSFAAIANVPLNSRTGVSVGGQNGPINVSLNVNGTILTPAQLSQFADLIAAALKRQIAA